MPLLTDLSDPSEWVEPDDVPRPVVAYGMASVDVGSLELELHRHAKGPGLAHPEWCAEL